MKLTTLIAVPLVLMTQGYTLVITHNNGTKTQIPTDEITKMEFLEDGQTPEPGQLDTPHVIVSKSAPDAYRLNWSRVEGASYYGWRVDDDAKLLTTSGYQCGISDLTVGDHTVKLWAYPAAGSGYKESIPFEATLTADLVMRTNVISKEKTSVSLTVTTNTTDACTAGIVPASVKAAADQINYVNTNSDSQRMVFDATPGKAQSVDFAGLTPDTEYNVVVFLSNATDQVFATNLKTNPDLNPGDKGSVFPAGVSAEGGWIDVDKVQNLSPYGWSGEDTRMCWACTVSGMIQWWLNDYKAKTGHDFETIYPIPTESKCYSTPIMDLYVDYWLHDGGSMFDPLKWFFRPVGWNTGNGEGSFLLDESKPNWKGGFGGMTEDETQALMVVNEKSSNGYNTPLYEFHVTYDGGKTDEDLMRVFSQKVINALRQGPLALSIVGSIGNTVHGVSCWGADYEVLSDGTLKVKELYISENDPLAGNVKNGMNKGIITYENGYVKVDMPTTGKKNINMFFGIRGYQGN